MADLLIRDVPQAVIAALDANAKRLGLSRVEYVRRQIAQAAVVGGSVNREHFRAFADAFVDLDDPAVMSRAWQ